ncbi:MAG: hypothetical protein AAGC72_02615 [Planctomycetota bacterium]
MKHWWFAAVYCCILGSLAHGAAIEAIHTEGQGLLPVVEDDLPTLPAALLNITDGAATVRLDLRNDGQPSPGVFLLPLFVTNIGVESWEHITFSLDGESVTFLLAPVVEPFAITQIGAASKTITATGGSLLPGSTAFSIIFLNAADSGGEDVTTFSANLVISVPGPRSTVPEPGVVAALGFAAIAVGGYRFRKNTGSPFSTSAT